MTSFCYADDLTIAPSKASAFSVSKEAAVEDFKPRGYNCSIRSLEPAGSYAWDVTNFAFTRRYSPPDPGQNGTGSYTDQVEFYYNNTATDNDWPRNTGWRQCLYITDESQAELDGVKQLECMMSFEPFRLGFKFDNVTSTLALSQGWTCDGTDSKHT